MHVISALNACLAFALYNACFYCSACLPCSYVGVPLWSYGWWGDNTLLIAVGCPCYSMCLPLLLCWCASLEIWMMRWNPSKHIGAHTPVCCYVWPLCVCVFCCLNAWLWIAPFCACLSWSVCLPLLFYCCSSLELWMMKVKKTPLFSHMHSTRLAPLLCATVLVLSVCFYS